MSTVLTLVRKDFALFLRNRAAVVLTFLIPFVLIYIFGQVFGAGGGGGSGPTGIPLAVVNASPSPAAERLVRALTEEPTFRVRTSVGEDEHAPRPMTEADARDLLQNNALRFALIIPADFLPDDGFALRLQILSNPRNEIETQLVHGILQRTIFTQLPQVFGQVVQARGREFVGAQKLDAFNRTLADTIAGTFGGDSAALLRDIEAGAFFSEMGTADSGNGGGDADLLSQLVRLESEQVVGAEVKSPAATRIVGGFAIQFLLFAVSSSAAALFYERDYGLFQRLLAGPVRRSQILWSKFLYGVVLGLVQIVVLFVGGSLLFGIDVSSNLFPLLLMSIAAAAACTAFGMFIASMVKTPEAASSLSTFLILVMCAVGGAWFPVSLMPEAVQVFSRLTVVYWAVEGFALVLWAGAPLSQLLLPLGVLAGTTVAVLGLALWRFQRSPIFD